MAATNNGSTKSSAPSPEMPSNRFDYSKLPEHMRERSKIADYVKDQMRLRCIEMGIKVLH